MRPCRMADRSTVRPEWLRVAGQSFRAVSEGHYLGELLDALAIVIEEARRRTTTSIYAYRPIHTSDIYYSQHDNPYFDALS
jgi:hypothetical protein